MPSTIISLRDRQRTAGLDLLDLIDHEVRSMTTIICLFEQLRRLASDCDDAVEPLREIAEYSEAGGPALRTRHQFPAALGRSTERGRRR